MTKSELKPGYLVQLKNGDVSMVMASENGIFLIDKPVGILSSYSTLDHYRNDMSHELDHLTIMKVYGCSKYYHQALGFCTENRKLLWERKPEKKQYTYAQLREILGEEFEVVG